MIHLAIAFKGLIVAVEHRCGPCPLLCRLARRRSTAVGGSYYGISYPTPDFSTPNLAFLTSRQALADLAAIHDMLVVQYHLTDANRFVSFGGSYPVRPVARDGESGCADL